MLSLLCVKCKDTDALGTDPRPRFGGIFELLVANSAEPGFWGERWELYKVRSALLIRGRASLFQVTAMS